MWYRTGENKGVNKFIGCIYGTHGSSANINIDVPNTFKSDTCTLIIFTTEDDRETENLTITGANLIETVTGVKYGIYYVPKYRMYSVSGKNVVISFAHGNTNAGIGYVLIDKSYNNMVRVNEPVSFENKNALYLCCNMSDHRGFTYIDGDSSGFVCHLMTPNNVVNFSSYFTNVFTVYSLLENGSVKMNRKTTNQYGETIMLS